MNPMEQRLADALRARTDLVTPERLTPAAPPAAVVQHRWRRPAAYSLVAAAAVVAVAVPLAVLQGSDPDQPDPVVTPPAETGADWPVVERREETDVTGDGEADELVLRREPAPGHRARVEVTGLAGAWALVEGRPDAMAFAVSTDLDDVSGDEITLRHTASDSGFPALDVLTVRDGRLVQAVPAPGDAALSSPVRDGLAWGWWFAVDGDADGLFSARAEPTGDPADSDAVWRWRVSADGTRITPTKVGTEAPQGSGGFAAGSSPFADRSDERIGIDEEFSTNLDGGGDDSVRLFTPGDAARLEVTFDDGTTTQIDLDPPQSAIDAGGLLPSVHTTYLAERRPMLVVRWGGTEGVTRVYDLGGDERTLRQVGFTSTFGDNADEEGGLVHSVLTADGSFYALHRAGEEAVDVYRWEVAYDGDEAVYLVLGNQGRPIGRWCADGPEGAGWVTCT